MKASPGTGQRSPELTRPDLSTKEPGIATSTTCALPFLSREHSIAPGPRLAQAWHKKQFSHLSEWRAGIRGTRIWLGPKGGSLVA